jgi:RNA polymerase sigma factor (sigma-70 family)
MTYRVEVKIRNGVLFKLMEGAGIKTVQELSRLAGTHPGNAGKLANLLISPLRADGRPRVFAKKIAGVFGVSPEDLCPAEMLLAPLQKNKSSVDVSHEELARYLPGAEDPASLEDQLEMARLPMKTQDLLAARLTQREQKVINQRYGLNGEDELTLGEIGEQQDVSRERIRQIEQKALRKLRPLGELVGWK